jgi:hypothetical protein
MERFNPKTLNRVEGKEQYPIKISDRCAAFKNVEDVDINRAWETAR